MFISILKSLLKNFRRHHSHLSIRCSCLYLIASFFIASHATSHTFSQKVELLALPENRLDDSIDVAFNEDGFGVLAWSEKIHAFDGDYEYDQIFINAIDLEGNLIGPSFEVSSESKDIEQFSPQVGVDNEGNIVVAWTKKAVSIGGNSTIAFRKFSREGVAASEELLADEDPLSNESESDIAVLPNGDFIIAWSNRSVLGQEAANVYARRFNADGTAKELPIKVNESASFKQAAPVLRAESNGSFAVAWERWTMLDGWDIAFRAIDSQGNFLSTERIIRTNGKDRVSERRPSLDINESEIVLAWECHCKPLRKEIFIQRFDLTGESRGNQFQPSPILKSNQVTPSIAYGRNSQLSLIWQNRNPIQSQTAIYSQDFSTANTPQEPPVLVESLDKTQAMSSLKFHADNNGIQHLVWAEGKPSGLASLEEDETLTQRTLFYRNAQVTLALDDRSVNPKVGKVYLAGVTHSSNVETWQWEQILGPTVELSANNEDVVTFVPPQQDQDTVLKFQVTTTSTNGVTATDAVSILVSHEAGFFEDNEMIEQVEEHSFSEPLPLLLNFITTNELDSETVRELEASVTFSKHLSLPQSHYQYDGQPVTEAIITPKFIKRDATSVVKIAAIADDGTFYEKLQIIKLINKPSSILKPNFYPVTEWYLNGHFAGFISPKDPNDVLESCTWEQISGVEIYDPQGGGPFRIKEIIDDNGESYTYLRERRLYGGITEDTVIELRRTCTFEDGFTQVDDFNIELKNTPFEISRAFFITPQNEGGMFLAGPVWRGGIDPPVDYCEVQQMSGPALIPTQAWNEFITPNVDEDSIIEVDLVCVSIEGEEARSSIEFTVYNSPDFDFDLVVPDPIEEQESYTLQVIPVLPYAVEECNAEQIEGVALEWTGPLSFTAPNIGFDQDATVEITCTNTGGESLTKEYTLPLKNVYHEIPVVAYYASSDMYSGHRFPVFVAYGHPWAEIIESTWEHTEGPEGTFEHLGPVTTCFIPPDVEEETDIAFSVSFRDEAGNSRSVDFNVTVFPEHLYEENYQGTPDFIEDYCAF